MARFSRTICDSGITNVHLLAVGENHLIRTADMADEILKNTAGNQEFRELASTLKDVAALLLSKCVLPKHRVGANEEADAKPVPTINASNERLAS